MGSNFGDLDNDGFLDFYLGTGDPDLSTLVPNRMFKNVGGGRFAEITSSTGTGNLQKGHGISFADWDRDGDLDVFIEMGGAAIGDRYHNILFQNPGQGNHWLTVKLVGKKTNRAAIGARIKVVASGESHTLSIGMFRPVVVGGEPCSSSTSAWVPIESQLWKFTGRPVEPPRSSAITDADQAIEVTGVRQGLSEADWKPVPAPIGSLTGSP